MKTKLIWAAPLAAIAALAAAPLATAKSPVETDHAKPKRQCFWTQSVNNFASDDEKYVNVRVGVRDVYQFEMMGRCPDVDWSHKIAIVSRGSSSICSGLDATIIAPSPIGPQRCAVRNMRKLTEAEIAALPRRARP